MSKKLLLIVNPAAGKGKGRTFEKKVCALYEHSGWTCDIRNTQGAGDAAEFATKDGADADMIGCIGGDGTLSETLGGLTKLPAPPPLCYVPMGSTNDLAISVGLPRKPMKAAKCGLEGHAQPIDVGKLNGTIFSYVACFGAFSRTSYITGRKMKNRLGHLAYILTGASELNRIRPYHVHIEGDELALEGNFLFGAVCNTRSLGGALHLPVDKNALHDGRHELLLVREPKHIYQAVSLLWSLANGKYDHPLIVCKSVSHAVFHMPEEMPWSLDGERADLGKTVEFENMPSAYRIMLP
jgi:diacylglycerol kinase (ATP)